MTLLAFSLALPLLLFGTSESVTAPWTGSRSLVVTSRMTADPTVTPAGALRRTAADTDAAVAARLATITTDTGAFAPGRRAFERYETPALCWAAAANARKVFQRSVLHYEQHLFPGFDTAGLSAATAVARTCGARFTLANTPRAQLGDLFMLALFEQNDTLAEAAVARRLADRTKLNPYASDDPERAAPADLEFVPYKSSNVISNDVREAVFLQFLAFGRFAAARRFLAQVDQTVSDTALVRLDMHRQFAELERAYGTDSATMLHEDSTVIRLGLAYKGSYVGYHFVLEAYRDLVNLAVHEDSSRLLALEQRAKHDLATFSQEQQQYFPNDVTVDWKTSEWTVGQERALVPQWYRYAQGVDSRPAPRLHADFWFPAPGRPAADTIIPVPGKFNLICGGGIAKDYMSNRSQKNETDVAFVQAVHLKQWLAEYGNSGLVATVIRPAIGAPWVSNDAHGSKDIYVRDSAAEAKFWQWYDQAYHQLPVTEGVVVLHTTQVLPPPDGRRIRVEQTVDTQYFNLLNELDEPELSPESGACTLVDPDGRILYQQNMARWALTNVGDNNLGSWSDVLKWVFTRYTPSLATHAHQ